MTDPIAEGARRFQKVVTEAFGSCPQFAPACDWPSLWMIDGLSYHLRYRNDWSKHEESFFNDLCAMIAQVVLASWKTFHADCALKQTSTGIECIATLKKGLFSNTEYVLPINQALRGILQQPSSPFPVLGKQLVMASDKTNLVGLFILGACLGMSPYGKGPWSDKAPGELQDHLDRAVPFLADTTASFHQRVFGNGSGADPALYRHHLVWPPANYHMDYCHSVAMYGIVDYENETCKRLSAGDLLNLAKFPDDAVAGGAIVLLLSRLTAETLKREFIELTFDMVATGAGAYRAVAIECAQKDGRAIDWLATRDEARFVLEKRVHLLPLLHLDFKTCMNQEYRPLVESLVNMNIEEAQGMIDKYSSLGPDYLFQKGMLDKIQGKHEPAAATFSDLATKYPEYRNPDYLNEYGMACLNIKQTDKAIELLREAAAQPTPHGRAISNLGWALMCKEQLDEAMPVLDRAVETSDQVVTALLNRLCVHFRAGRVEQCEKDVDAALKLTPYSRRVLNHVARRMFME